MMMRRIEVGSCVGKYTITSEIGRGGMGVVYLAEDTVLGRSVALKALPASMMFDDAFVGRFRSEAKVIAALSHPHIVHVHTFDVVEGVPIIEMEYIEGGSLSRKFQHEFVSAPDIVHYAHGIADALSFCHSMNAVHRDVKPSNILIDKMNRSRLADFGIASALLDLEQSTFASVSSGVFQGTPLYAPPEAWDGEPPSQGWDTYGLGAVIYQGLTGAPPYDAMTPIALAKKIATTTIPPLIEVNDSVSIELACLVDEMLRPDPKSRLSDASEVTTRLEEVPEFNAFSDSRTLRVRRRTSKRRQKKRATAAMIGMAVIGAFLATGLFAGYRIFRNSGVDDQGAGRRLTAGNVQPDDAPQRFNANTIEANATAAQWLSHTRAAVGPDSAIMDARFSGRGQHPPETWLVAQSAAGEPTRILAFSTAQIAMIELLRREDSDEFVANGNWAGFVDTDGTVLRFGVISGTLRWRPDPPSLLGALVFVSDQDGSVSETTVSAVTHSAVSTDMQFLYQMEESEYILPLLYRELLPRGSAWAQQVESLLPSFPEGRVAAMDAGPAAASIKVDGILDEPIWRSAVNEPGANPPTQLPGVPRSRRPILTVLRGSDSVFIAARCMDAALPESLRLDVRLATSFAVPLSAAAVLHIVHDGAANSTRTAFVGAEHSVAGTCRFASSSTGSEWQAEGQIPFTLLQGPASPGPWRLNAVLYHENASGVTPLCRWGFADETAARHGAIVELEP